MEIKFRDVVAFRTEDAKFPAANLLRGGKWLSERKSRSSVNDITLHFGEAHLISHIDIGNWGSSFISIEVSRVGLQRYQTLLPSTELMSARDAHTKTNWTSVHMFSKEHFVDDVVEKKWTLMRVTCLQPFLQNEQFGLSFVKVFSIAEDELPAQQPEPQSPPPGSVFAMMRDCALAKVSPVVVNRSQQLVLAAIEKQRTPLKCRREAIVASSSNVRERSPAQTDSPKKKYPDKIKIPHTSTKETLYNQVSQNYAATLHTSAQTSRMFMSPTSAGSNKCKESHLTQARRSSSLVDNTQKCRPPYAAKSGETSRNMKRQIAFLTPSASENDLTSPELKAACKRRLESSDTQLELLQTQVNSPHGGRQKNQEICDVTVLSDSDSEAPTIVLPSAALSPGREQRDFDSDTDSVILPLNKIQNKKSDIEEVVTFEIPSSPEDSSADILLLDRDAIPGPSRISCPLCSDFFDVSSIERHAATCGLTSETEVLICPVCLRYFPPEVLPQHADLCAERTRT